MEQNLRNQDYHHAFLYGEKLFSINPNIEKLYDTLIFIAAKTKNWNQIILLSDKAFSNKIISKNDLNENKSIGFYEIAKIKFDSDIKDALKNILFLQIYLLLFLYLLYFYYIWCFIYFSNQDFHLENIS